MTTNPFSSMMTRLHLDEQRAAEYLGVPVFTLRKWIKGERTPNSSARRLLHVLGTVEALAPQIHEMMVPPVQEHGKKSTKGDKA